MASSVTPLSDSELDLLKAHLVALPDFDRFSVTTLLYTGIHPCVLSDPKRFHLILDRGILEWRRPKTARFIRFPVVPQLEPFIGRYLEHLYETSPRHRRYFGYLCARIGKAIGIRGRMTARTMRHTAIRLAYRRLRDVNAVSVLFGAAQTQVLEYARTEEVKEAMSVFAKEGF